MGSVREYLPVAFSDKVMDYLTEQAKSDDKVRSYLLSLAAPKLDGKNSIEDPLRDTARKYRATNTGRLRRLYFQMLSGLERDGVISVRKMFEINGFALTYPEGNEIAKRFDQLPEDYQEYLVEVAKQSVPDVYYELANKDSTPKERLQEMYERKYPYRSRQRIPEHISWFRPVVFSFFRTLPDTMEELVMIGEDLRINLALLFGLDEDIALIAESPKTEKFMGMYLLIAPETRRGLEKMIEFFLTGEPEKGSEGKT